MTQSNRSHLALCCLLILQFSFIGCSRSSKTLVEMDREMRSLAMILSPSIVVLQPITDNGEQAGLIGSAVSIGKHGELLTTASILSDGRPLQALLSNGVTVPVTLVGADWEANLALLKLETGITVPEVALVGPSEISVGQLGFLIGTAPMVQGAFITYGTMAISSLGGDDPYNDRLFALMSTSMLARPGSPVFNTSGQIIGMIDGRMQVPNGGCWSVIPLRSIRKLLPLLELGGGVPRGFLGIIPGKLAETNSGVGITVAAIEPNSPAEANGLKAGDIIFEVDNVRMAHVSSLRIAITSKPNSNITLKYLRTGQVNTITVKPESRVITANDATRNPNRKL